MCSSDVFLAVLAVLFPPIAVWIKCGICTADSIINILLCTLGYLPGLLHAWYIISLYPEPSEYDYDTLDPEATSAGGGRQGAGRVSYYYVNRAEGDGEGLNAQGRPVVYGTVAGLPAQQPKQPQAAPPMPPSTSREEPRRSQNEEGGSANEGGGGSGVPPSYDQAVAGDNKVQR